MTVRRFRTSPPLLKDEKKEGPTCSPTKKMKSVRPKSRMKKSTGSGTVRPKCPAASPTKRTKVTPSEMPATLMRPRSVPRATTSA